MFKRNNKDKSQRIDHDNKVMRASRIKRQMKKKERINIYKKKEKKKNECI